MKKLRQSCNSSRQGNCWVLKYNLGTVTNQNQSILVKAMGQVHLFSGQIFALIKLTTGHSGCHSNIKGLSGSLIPKNNPFWLSCISHFLSKLVHCQKFCIFIKKMSCFINNDEVLVIFAIWARNLHFIQEPSHVVV